MYTDEKGRFKGEALVVYFRPESVNLAIQMLDDSDFRLGVTGPDGPMKVQKADFSFKSQREAPAQSSGRDKKKIIQRTQKLNRYAGCYHLNVILLLISSVAANWPIGTTMTLPLWRIRPRNSKRLSF